MGLWLIISKYGMSIYLIFSLITGMLAVIFYKFWMVDPTMSLRFKFKKTPLIKDIKSHICIHTGRILQQGTESIETEEGTVDVFFRKSISTFSIRLTGALFKSQVVVAYNSPGIFLLLIRWKILLILRYAFVDREVHKSLNYQPKFSQMERPLVNVL